MTDENEMDEKQQKNVHMFNVRAFFWLSTIYIIRMPCIPYPPTRNVKWTLDAWTSGPGKENHLIF